MSCVYWHAKERDAELRGSERAWLGHLADGPARAAWDLDGGFDRLDRAVGIVSMVPEVPDGEYGSNYLHTMMRAAVEQDKANRAYYSRKAGDPYVPPADHEPIRRFIESLRTRLGGVMSDTVFEVAGHPINSWTAGLNSAIVAGSRPIQLAARIHGQCEIHAFVEGGDRSWLAEVIDEGLATGIYRRGIWLADGPDSPKDRWSSQGWEDVQALLRESVDGPVVMSYSVCDQFPNPTTDLLWPGRDVKSWDDYSDEEKSAVEDWSESWYENEDHDTRWTAGVTWLRERQPWARIAPDTLGVLQFSHPVTVYDLLAPDRDDRVRLAMERLAAQ